MIETKFIMEEFMNELSENKFKKEFQPNNGPDITDSFLNEKLREYSILLDSGIIDSLI